MPKQLGEIDITGVTEGEEIRTIATVTRAVWFINDSGVLEQGTKLSVQSYHRADRRVILIVNKEE